MPCGVDTGECTAGVQRCTAGVWSSCSGVAPMAESCNGRDDDCDGANDNGYACVQGSSQSCAVCGGSGTQNCRPDCLAWEPCRRAEECNGCDDDANGSADNGFMCVQNTPGLTCTTACGTSATRPAGAAIAWRPETVASAGFTSGSLLPPLWVRWELEVGSLHGVRATPDC